MSALTVLNDWHLGAIRSAGTTPATAYQLRLDLLHHFEDVLYGIETDLLLNGDLFDTANIPTADLLRTFQTLSDWLTRTGKRLLGSNGNHDLSKNSTILSSFQLLMKLLREVHGPDLVFHIETGTDIGAGQYVIPHVANQSLFDVELARVPACDYLFVHCNYDNEFAVESDHSLNMSKAQAEACLAKRIVFGHEHQARTELGGKVIIVGNQTPSSISDCLGNSSKTYLQILPGVGEVFPVSWNEDDEYSEQDWRDLQDRGRFIRVTGTATAEEGAQVVQAIARFRQQAKALVITNAVKVQGVNDQDDLVLTQEAVSAFNVQEALLEILTPEEGAKILKLLNPETENAQ
jgi:hypothetical protein